MACEEQPQIPDDCGDISTVVVDTELLPPIASRDDCDDPLLTGQGTPVNVLGVVDVCVANGITVDVVVGEVEITNEVGNPIPTTDETPAVQRLVDGDFQENIVGGGPTTITIPDGVLSFAVSVLEGGTDPTVLTDWPTIDGPDFAAPVPLRRGQSVSHAADEGHGNTLNGPITVSVPDGSAVNATWVLP